MQKQSTKGTESAGKEPAAQEKKKQSIVHVRDITKFNPLDFLIDIEDPKTGETSKYLEVRNRILWFWSVYPNGRLIQKATITDTYVQVESEVYFDRNADKPESNGFAMRWFNDHSEKTLEWAETTAIGRALNNCGFGTQYSGDDLEEPEPANAGIPTSIPKAKPEAEPENKSGNSESASDEAPEVMPIEFAAKIKCPIGTTKGKTMGDLYKERNREELVYFSEKFVPRNEQDKQVNIAASVMLAYYDDAIEKKKKQIKEEVDEMNKVTDDTPDNTSANTTDGSPNENAEMVQQTIQTAQPIQSSMKLLPWEKASAKNKANAEQK